MREGTFFHLELKFSDKGVDVWLKMPVKNGLIEEQPEASDDCGNDDYSQERDILAVINDLLSGSNKKYTVSTLFEELEKLQQKGKIYFYLKKSSDRFEANGYFEDAVLEKFFEPLANACAMAQSFKATGHALFISDQKAKWRVLGVAITVTPKQYQLVPAYAVLYPGKKGFIDYLKHPLLQKILKNSSVFFNKNKPSYWKEKYSGKFGFIDKDLNFIIEPQWTLAGVFSGGLAPVYDKEKDLWGYIDHQGKYAIEPSFFSAQPFYDGLACVRKSISYDPKSPNKIGFIDTGGKTAIGFKYDYADNFYQGLARIGFVSEKLFIDEFGFIDTKGHTIVEPTYSDCAYFAEGLCFVAKNIDGQEKWGAMDLQQKMVIPPLYTFASTFSEGLAPVYLDGKCGYINPQGKFVFKPLYDSGTIFSEGIAFVFKDKVCYLINKQGELIKKFKEKFQEVYPFKHGLAVVKYKDLYGAIDTTGKFVIKPQFQSLTICEDEPFILAKIS